MNIPVPVNFLQWIEANRHLLKPPVANKMVWTDGDMIVMVVGGPNQRKDYHYNPTPEFFYQIEGNMVLKIKDKDEFRDIPIRAGEIFLLPSGVPHSPQREANSIGLVIETKRPDEALDGLMWYCQNCGHLLYAEQFVLKNVETQFPPVFDRFFSDPAHRTCSQCQTVMPDRN